MVTPPLETIMYAPQPLPTAPLESRLRLTQLSRVLITAVTGTGLIEATEMAEADEVREVVAVRGTEGKGIEVIVTGEIVETETEEIEVTGVTDTANVPGRLVVIAHPGVPGAILITIVWREQSGIESVNLTDSLAIWT